MPARVRMRRIPPVIHRIRCSALLEAVEMKVVVAGSRSEVRPVVIGGGNLALVSLVSIQIRSPVEAVLVEHAARGAVSQGVRPAAKTEVTEHGPGLRDRDWGIECSIGQIVPIVGNR